MPTRGGDATLDELITLVVILLVIFPVAAVLALVFSIKARGQLRRIESRIANLEGAGTAGAALRGLELRLSALEASRRDVRPDAAEPAQSDVRPTPAVAAVAPEPSAASAPAPPPAGPAPSAPSPPSLPPTRPLQPSLEERFGTRWVVWVGGLALALGGIFLVRYSIEQGLVGPGVRVTLGALLAIALVGAGDWLRRQESRSGIAGVPAAHIPSILTAAGTTVAYATVYAAYALYGFLGPAVTFLLLGVVALATLAAALLHGPALAALGLVGAEVAPLLVSTEEPNYWALYVYLAVVTAAAFLLARARLWRWLAITAVAFGLFWTLPGIDLRDASGLAPHLVHVTVGFGLVALLIVPGILFGPSAAPGRIDRVSSGAIAAYVLAAAYVVEWQDHAGAALAVFAVLTAATVAIAWRSEAAAGALPATALLAALVIISWAVRPEISHLVVPQGGLATPEPSSSDVALHCILGAFFALLYGAAGYLTQGRHERAAIPTIWAATAVLAPLAILVALYYGIYGLERSIPFAGLALLLAAWFAVATEQLTKRAPRPGLASAAALHAAGSAAALALTLTFALEKGWLTVGLALMAPGVAWVAQMRPLPMLRWIAAAAAALVLARIGWEPRIVGTDVGTTPFFNWLLYGYGVPALAFWVAGHLLRRRADDTPARIVDVAAILFTVLFAFMEIRHAMNGGDVYASTGGLGEVALQVAVGLALVIGLERLRLRTGSIIHNVAALIIAALTLAAIVFGLLIADMPLSTRVPVGGTFFNLILLGYGLPALLAFVLALVTRTTRPMAWRAIAAGTSVLLALVYLSLEVMRLYHGPVIAEGAISDAEQYTLSAVWLTFGVALLIAGLLIESKPARLASAAVIVATVVKVFVIDLAHLAGIWRALSFIGLGLVLVAIGYLYQRLLYPRGRPPAAAAESTAA